MKYLITVAIALFLLVQAKAQVEQYRWVVGSDFGVIMSKGKPVIKGVALEPHIGYAFQPNWTISLQGTYVPKADFGYDYRLYQGGLSTTRYLGRRNIQPLFGVQAGWIGSTPFDENQLILLKPVSGPYIGLHGGLVWWVSEHIGLRIKGNYNWLLKGSTDPSRISGVTLGAVFQIGRGKPIRTSGGKSKEELPKW